MGLLIAFFLLSIILSFLCSVWEAVLLSITPFYVNKKVREKSSIGGQLEAYKKDIDKPLSAILTLNTIAHTVGAIGVGAQAGKLFGANDFNLGVVSLSYESVIAGLMTLAILILSEIIPKTIGANMWQTLAPFTIRSIRILIIILFPLVWLSQWVTKRLKKDKSRSILSRSDFAHLAEAGVKSGTLDSSESKIIQNLLILRKLVVRDIMTPRSVMVVAEEDITVEQFDKDFQPINFSRIPIYQDEQQDKITGFVLKDDIYIELAKDHHQKKLQEIRRDILFVHDTDSVPTLMDTLLRNKEHISIVVDNYGSVAGLVTLEDIFETLLGLDIVDETDEITNLRSFARGQWKERAKKLGLLPS